MDKDYEVIDEEKDIIWKKIYRISEKQALARDGYRPRKISNYMPTDFPKHGDKNIYVFGVECLHGQLLVDDNGPYLHITYDSGSFTGGFSGRVCYVELGEEERIYTENYLTTFGERYNEEYHLYKVAFRCVDKSHEKD